MKLNIKGKKVAVLGLGLEGLSSLNFLVKKGAKVTVCDQKEKSNIDTTYLKAVEKLGATLKTGSEYLNNLKDYDLIVRSPGIKLDNINKQELNSNSPKITSQTNLFFELCPGKIIGVTGTKGKGTTSSLIYEMLKKEGLDAYLVGNIGSPALDILDNLNDQSIIVYELSSFQLQDLKKSPHVAVMLMTVPEHLDYHQDMEEYVDAKRNIFRFQKSEDYAIVNYDYPASNESDIYTDAKVLKVSREQELSDGAYVRNGSVYFKKDGKEEKIVDTKDILLPGAHNLENVCAAVIAASLLGVSKEEISSVLKTFKGLEHRLELVDTIGGVKYYDDSFSTTPETAIAAILAFSDPEILILGGSSKNSDFTELGRIISEAKNIKAIIGIGEEWEQMKKQFPFSSFRFPVIEGAKNMETIVKAATKIAKIGDVVLLSPACASFSMFKNYKDRGEQFKSEVHKLRLALN
ncbi:UDP-N-acetylmuramoyl-L-alanine--D-glutamate ligase [Patescibacteria group bacterium]|nr:UDP-N-acetylmuramoyl-L-alanine--D-glutamate ligase [Patescibacteria group bacterium]